MTIPNNILFILEKLNNSGYEAYIVGGCVRDSLLGKIPMDYDITTNALPSEIKKVFSECKIINNNGEKHGTVTVRYNHENIEITTFRHDGEYNDHRHPNNVEFTRNLKEDLARRDFTINAMAMDKELKLYDYFDGVSDLDKKLVKCVEAPQKRFEEDALRILRALRFASTLEFDIDSKTLDAMYALKNTLSYVSKERIKVELDKMICGKRFTTLMKSNRIREIFAEIIPDIRLTFDFDQRSKYHTQDLYNHTLSVVENVIPNHIVKLAALFHDIGKTKCYQEDIKDGKTIYHFIGHPVVSKEMCEAILKELRYSNDELEKISFLVEYHDYKFSGTLKNMRKFLMHMPLKDNELLLDYLISLKKADTLDHTNVEVYDFDSIKNVYHQIKDNENECYNLKSLKINGSDLLNLGYSGKIIGEILNKLVSLIVEEKLVNDREKLITYVKNNY